MRRCKLCNWIARTIILVQICAGGTYLLLLRKQQQNLGNSGAFENEIWKGIGVSFGASAFFFGPLASMLQLYTTAQLCPKCMAGTNASSAPGGDGDGAEPIPPQQLEPALEARQYR